MHRLLLLLLLAFPVWAQEAGEDEPDSASETADPAEQENTEDVDIDDVFDELYSEEDEDAFIPSEDVKFGQSIPFPTDI